MQFKKDGKTIFEAEVISKLEYRWYVQCKDNIVGLENFYPEEGRHKFTHIRELVNYPGYFVMYKGMYNE